LLQNEFSSALLLIIHQWSRAHTRNIYLTGDNLRNTCAPITETGEQPQASAHSSHTQPTCCTRATNTAIQRRQQEELIARRSRGAHGGSATTQTTMTRAHKSPVKNPPSKFENDHVSSKSPGLRGCRNRGCTNRTREHTGRHLQSSARGEGNG
jgi:hypothetical protein